jgi:hypothetical protein
MRNVRRLSTTFAFEVGNRCRVTDVAQDEPRDDRADPVQLKQRRARRDDGVPEAALGGGDVSVETTDVGQQLQCTSWGGRG